MEDKLQLDEALCEAQTKMDINQFDKALPILDKLVKTVEKSEPYKDDEDTEYHSFNEDLEELLYKKFEKPKKDICNISEPISKLYLAYGSALMELKDKEKAKKALLTALHWNPVDPAIHLQLAEWESHYGDKEEVLKCAEEALKWSFHQKNIGNCYYYFGWYMDQIEVHSAALGYYRLCSDWGDGDRKYLSDKETAMLVLNQNTEVPTLMDMETYSIKYNVPLSYNSKIVDFVLEQGNKAASDCDKETAVYFFSILYEMTGSENVKDTLDQLKEELEMETETETDTAISV
ncbi:TPR repeat protein [Anaerovibrio sp. JC8]|uniref:tetratricopeptide repeat protein n=1 Tax=Anaerovibrio sp. JC8 TaxID=1240085 RepID=UPI000A0C9317|nr:hypothetical protein [Anaerovibrio sp. JC8]ORT98769.1 TPR repeat protein [Anaerovibrio sp. JC8]